MGHLARLNVKVDTEGWVFILSSFSDKAHGFSRAKASPV